MTRLSRFYQALVCDIDADRVVDSVVFSDNEVVVASGSNVGVSSYLGSSDFDVSQYVGMSLRAVAEKIMSWNFSEASVAMACINCYYNQICDNDYLYGDAFLANSDRLSGIVATIGHFKHSDQYFTNAKDVRIFERNCREGDYPDSAMEYILNDSDIVFITGQTIINKTIERILQLCRNSYVVLVGQSSPLCSALFDFGINEVAGTVHNGEALKVRIKR